MTPLRIKPKALLVLGILANKPDLQDFTIYSYTKKIMKDFSFQELTTLLSDMYDAKLIDHENHFYFVRSSTIEVAS